MMKKLLTTMALLTIVSCTTPGPLIAAVGTYDWTHPTETINGMPINPDYIHHYVVFYVTSGTQDGLEDAMAVVYDEYASPPWDTGELDPMMFYQFAVSAIDTTGATGLMSQWSDTWYPAGSDPGVAAAPGAPALINSRVW
jgi:hypothetical protein